MHMPLPLKKRGFITTTPLVGSVLFLTAALIAVTIFVENEAKISVARSAQTNDKLEFMSQAIQADSYDVLLQQSLETLTTDFIKKDYFSINTDETWRESLKSNLVEYFTNALGTTLGLDISAYAHAYGNIPGMDKCVVDSISEGMARADVYDAPIEEGTTDDTIMARGYSFGQSISCKSYDPEGSVKVDIGGRYYRINVRVPKLYELAKLVISTAKVALNGHQEGIPEPIASWTAEKWAIVNRVDNKLLDPNSVKLDEIIAEWVKLMDGWFSSKIKDLMEDKINADTVGINLDEFAVKQADEVEYTLAKDFEISCDAENKAGVYRNCMPFRVAAVLGNKKCSGMEPPENTRNPFYNLQSFGMTCGTGSCPGGLRDAMEGIVAPFGSVCISYYEYEDSVYPVCKKWRGKAKSILLKGALKDDNQDYVVIGQTESVFKFKSQQPDVNNYNIVTDRLTCEYNADDKNGDYSRYKDNVMKLLQNMEVKIGYGEIGGPNSVKRWVDLGSSLPMLYDDNLRSSYDNIYGHATLPIPCFRERDLGPYTSAKANEKCTDQTKPRVEMRIDWTETRTLCESRIDALCNAFCSGVALQNNAQEFCESMFPIEGHVGGGSGILKCKGGPACGDTLIKITSMSFTRAAMGET